MIRPLSERVFALTAAITLLAPWLARAGGPPKDDARRVPWTASRVAGTPDPPLPYVVEPAFPKLAFDRPVAMAPLPGSNRLVIAELGGKVATFPDDPGAVKADVALDLAAPGRECAALYGMAFHPQFEKNRHVYLCYVTKNDIPDGTRVSRFEVDRSDPPRIDPKSEEVAITFPSGGHNGGCLEFGNDGCLYISTGDAAGPSPPDSLRTGQDISDLLSSILRIDVDHHDPGKAYRVPPDNPFVHLSGARPEVWAFGLRNPWKMTFDRATGDLWVGDVGWELWELIYRVERGGNYGWSVMEGRQPVLLDEKRGPTPIIPPTIDHPHSEAASITGGYVYRGRRLKELQGDYIYGDYQSGKVWGARIDGKAVARPRELADTGLRLAAFGEGRDGELYLVEHERTNQVFRLVANPAPKPKGEFPKALSATGLFASTKDHQPAPGVVPYAINAPLWADGTGADRLLAIPGDGRVRFDELGNWKLPEGSVLARTVAIDLVRGDPATRRRLETQVLHFEDGSWRPYTYIWDDDQSDATLADAAGSGRTFEVRDDRAPGGRRELAYRFAARSECVLCHNPWVEARTTIFGRQSASPLAMSVEQLSRDVAGEDQLRRLERLGYFDKPLTAGDLPRFADPYDESADLNARARAYLHVNCSHCHQFNAGGAATIALGASVPLPEARMLDVRPTQGTFGIDDAEIIAPGEPERSVLYYRVSKTGAGRMPRVGSRQVDERASKLIGDWIAKGLPPGRPPERPSAEAEVLRALTAADATSAGRAEATRRLIGSTRGALALLRQIDLGRVPATTLREVVALTKDHPRVEVRDLFERFVPEAERIKRLGDTIDPRSILALPGDARRGREVFFAESATQCKTCHRVGGQGAEVGPELDEVGSKYARNEILTHILEPSRAIDQKYQSYLVATRDGQVLEGLIVEKTDRELVLRDAKAQSVRIPAADVEQQSPQSKSLMPEQLLKDLTAQQAADLLEFLASLKKR